MGNNSRAKRMVLVLMKTNLRLRYWPDYVFSDYYELMPLKELGDFIDKNGHLLNMPTANKVKEKIATGETIRLLTEKVEQLTLYILQ